MPAELCWALAGYLHRQIEGLCEQKKTGNRHTVQGDSAVDLPAEGLSEQICHCLLLLVCSASIKRALEEKSDQYIAQICIHLCSVCLLSVLRMQ